MEDNMGILAEDIKFSIIHHFTDVDPSQAIIENKYYRIEVDYIRDFAGDKAKGNIRREQIILNCKSKYYRWIPIPDLTDDDKILINLKNVPTILNYEDSSRLLKSIRIAQLSGEALREKVNELLYKGDG